jgi:hypothetical protein
VNFCPLSLLDRSRFRPGKRRCFGQAKYQSEIVEFTKGGKFIGEFSIDSAAGSAFGIAIVPSGEDSARFAAVDDTTNQVTVFRLNTP